MKSRRAERPLARGRPRSFDRDDALKRAMQVFWRQGYETTSLGDLTEAMRINPPSLYAAFRSKERLFLEAVERYRAGPGGAAARIFSEEPTARGAIERLLKTAATELTRRSHPPGCMLVTSAMNCSRGSKHLQARLAELRAASEASIRMRISSGVRDGELPRGTDAAALARFYGTVLQGMSIQARDGATRKHLLAIGEAAMRVWPR
jgi:TetR/AcrR family transcriptional regulator, copper-responsive repressor